MIGQHYRDIQCQINTSFWIGIPIVADLLNVSWERCPIAVEITRQSHNEAVRQTMRTNRVVEVRAGDVPRVISQNDFITDEFLNRRYNSVVSCCGAGHKYLRALETQKRLNQRTVIRGLHVVGHSFQQLET